MGHPNFPNVQGRVLLSVQLFSRSEALARPAGFGREEINDNPFLPKPNRPALSDGFLKGILCGRIPQLFAKFKLCCIITGVAILGLIILLLILKFK